MTSGSGSTSTNSMKVTPVEQLGYAEAKKELDDIVAELEGGEVDIDHLVGRVQRAGEIMAELERRIKRTREQVDELMPKLQQGDRSNEAEPAVDDQGGVPGSQRATAGENEPASFWSDGLES